MAKKKEADKLPLPYNPTRKKPLTYSGKRVKRGLYRSGDGTLVNADVNGAYNIEVKTAADFSLATLATAVGNRVIEWLHPTAKIRLLKQKTHQPYCHFKRRDKKSNPKLALGEGIKG